MQDSNERLVSPAEARRMCGGLSAATVHRLRQAGAFPRAVVLGRDRRGKPVRIAYVESELHRWIAERIQTGRQAA